MHFKIKTQSADKFEPHGDPPSIPGHNIKCTFNF